MYQNRNNIHLGFFMLVLVLSAVSCAPVYVPSSTFVFQSKEKGDIMITARQGVFASTGQVGVAATDHLNVGLQGAALYTGESSVGSTVYPGTSAFSATLVAGYYSRFTSKHTFELNGGVGTTVFNVPEEVSGFYSGYVQPSFTFIGGVEDRSEFTILGRAVGMSFIATENGSDTMIRQAFLEPMLNWSIGNQVKFQTQLGVSFPTRSRVYGGTASPFIWNVGISFRIPTRRKGELSLPAM